MRDFQSNVILHEIAGDEFEIGEFKIKPALVVHIDPTVGFRISSPAGVFTYIPDHEPALGPKIYPIEPEWTSGYDLAYHADLLMHDCQYTLKQYQTRIGWGHSSIEHAFQFAELAQVKHFVPIHHEPSHNDETLDRLLNEQIELYSSKFKTTPGLEGDTFELTA
jgi:hypothetical protein